jgi:hypothetical protein
MEQPLRTTESIFGTEHLLHYQQLCSTSDNNRQSQAAQAA